MQIVEHGSGKLDVNAEDDDIHGLDSVLLEIDRMHSAMHESPQSHKSSVTKSA